MKNNQLYCCKGIKENGSVCGNPLFVKKNEGIVIKRHGRIISVCKGQIVEIKCERCGNITKAGGYDGSISK